MIAFSGNPLRFEDGGCAIILPMGQPIGTGEDHGIVLMSFSLSSPRALYLLFLLPGACEHVSGISG
nr:MAG TPA: hypothetical protein [Caudoviricetes sp.]